MRKKLTAKRLTHKELAQKHMGDIKDLIKERGITYQEIADKMKIAKPNVSRMLNSPSVPRYDTLLKLCEAVGMSITMRPSTKWG